MAKNKKKWEPKRVRSEDERGGGSSQYITLDEGDKFLGYALFEGNPAEDEAGYYEYLEHWHQATKRSIPCAGEDCPLCEDGDKARTRAKTLWLVVTDESGNKLDPPQLRIFNFNYNLIKQFTEMRGEGDKIKGRLFRISKLDDRGNHGILPKTEMLKSAQVKEALKDKAAPDFEGLVTSQLQKAMEALQLARAMDDDDDDDDEDEKPAAKKKDKKADKKKEKVEEPDDDDDDDDDEGDADGEWPDDGLDEVEVTVKKVEKSGQWFEATQDGIDDPIKVWTTDDIEFDLTDLSKGDTVTVSTGAKDDDGDYVLSAEPETGGGDDDDDDDDEDAKGDDDDDNDLPDEIEDEEFVVVKINSGEDTIAVKSESLGLEFDLFFIDTMKVDYDDYSKGDKIKVTAEKDAQGDMVATEPPTIVKDKAKGGKKSGKSEEKSDAKKKGGKKGGKKK